MEQNNTMRKHAQELRRSMTKEERHLWYDFLKTYPIQFRRQQIFGSYIVDFYCYQARLVLELDGSQHCEPGAVAYDAARTAYLNSRGLQVLRISNRDVMTQFEGVCQMIDMAVQAQMGG